MTAGTLGFIDTPAQGRIRPDGVTWCADNGAFSARFDERKWWRFLEKHADDAATLARSLPWLPRIRALGYPVAFVAQNGATPDAIPWDQVDALFLGGTLECPACAWVWPADRKPARTQPCDQCGTRMREWKERAAARALAAEAKARGLWLHMGRVNGEARYRYALAIGCDSVDGTFLTFAPDTNLPRLTKWIDRAHAHPAPRLFGSHP